MLNAILTFAVGFICGIVVTYTYVRLERKKIKFYETYIHQRLEEALPYNRENLRPHQPG